MKMIIETFVTIIFLTIAVLLSAQVIGSQITINEANDFHINAVQVIEESNFDAEVIEGCIVQAEALGYTLSVNVNQQTLLQCASCNHSWELGENVTCEVCGGTNVYTNYVSSDGEVILDYCVEMGMLGISEEGRLEAYAR